jgi:nucleoid-associated protein YgaU
MSDDRPQDGVSSEYRKFGVLVAAFVIVVLAVAVLRPLIFEHIIPAILGLGATLPAAEPPTGPMAPLPPMPTALPPMAYPAPADPTAPPPEPTPTLASPTAVPPSEPATHTVQQGETLYQLAALYDVSVADLAAANGIDNPNQLAVGTVLIIP